MPLGLRLEHPRSLQWLPLPGQHFLQILQQLWRLPKRQYVLLIGRLHDLQMLLQLELRHDHLSCWRFVSEPLRPLARPQ